MCLLEGGCMDTRLQKELQFLVTIKTTVSESLSRGRWVSRREEEFEELRGQGAGMIIYE